MSEPVSDQQARGLVYQLYKQVLKREPDRPGLEANVRVLKEHGLEEGVGTLLRGFLSSDEWESQQRARIRAKGGAVPSGENEYDLRHGGAGYRVPDDLLVNRNDFRRVLLIGACLLGPWQSVIENTEGGCTCDHLLVNNFSELPAPPQPVTDYSFQVVSLPIRSVLPEASYFGGNWNDLSRCEHLFSECCSRIDRLLQLNLRFVRESGLLTFLANFFVPQQDPIGRLLPKADFRSVSFLVRRLNDYLAEKVSEVANTYIIDIDEIASCFGKKFIQDDNVCFTTHGGLVNDFDFPLDAHRIDRPRKLSSTLENRTYEFIEAVWHELVAAYRTVNQSDQVKIIIMDLDDSLWRGVLGEGEQRTGNEIEGWPLGVIEALAFLKKRGVLLGIVSRNEESVVRSIWPGVVGSRLRIDDFAFIKINWGVKAHNVREILDEANLLPRSAVYVDDNPVERASIQAALPDIRILGSDPYLVRRALLWAPEAQVASISAESADRTMMVRAQVERDKAREGMSREDFLSTLNIEICFDYLSGDGDGRFLRCLELINKTNQFNTTGQKWTFAELSAFISKGGSVLSFTVADKFTAYGLVGLMLISDHVIHQFVMSCRVLGLDVELTALAKVVDDSRTREGHILTARFVETERNFPCRDLYARAGFVQEGSDWNFSLV